MEQELLEKWRRRGFVVVEHLLSEDEVKDALKDVYQHYMPTEADYYADPLKYGQLFDTGPGWIRRDFPFLGESLRRLVVNPRLIGFAEAVLGTNEMMISHCQIIGKYAGKRDYDQQLHVDYGNNTVVFPDASHVADLPTITYLTDVTIDHGPTYVLSREHTAGRDAERSHPREEFPEGYELEEPVTVPAGSTLIYSMRTLHRGSRMRLRRAVRFTLHMGYRRRDAYYAGAQSWHRSGGSEAMDGFVEQATPRQRELVGFPGIADPYWNEETLDGVARRYPRIDLAPYRAVLGQ